MYSCQNICIRPLCVRVRIHTRVYVYVSLYICLYIQREQRAGVRTAAVLPSENSPPSLPAGLQIERNVHVVSFFLRYVETFAFLSSLLFLTAASLFSSILNGRAERLCLRRD